MKFRHLILCFGIFTAVLLVLAVALNLGSAHAFDTGIGTGYRVFRLEPGSYITPLNIFNTYTGESGSMFLQKTFIIQNFSCDPDANLCHVYVKATAHHVSTIVPRFNPNSPATRMGMATPLPRSGDIVLYLDLVGTREMISNFMMEVNNPATAMHLEGVTDAFAEAFLRPSSR